MDVLIDWFGKDFRIVEKKEDEKFESLDKVETVLLLAYVG